MNQSIIENENSMEREILVENAIPVESGTIVENVTPAESETIVENAAPVESETISENVAPVEGETIVENAAPAESETIGENEISVESEKPVENKSHARKKSSTDKKSQAEKMNNVLVGRRIKNLRLKQKMTREKLASITGISISFIYEIETGKKGFSVWTLRKLTEALRVNPDDIIYADVNEDSKEAIERKRRLACFDNLVHIQKLLAEAMAELKDVLSE